MFANKSFFEQFGCSLTHVCLAMYVFTLIHRKLIACVGGKIVKWKKGYVTQCHSRLQGPLCILGNQQEERGVPNIVSLFFVTGNPVIT
jgi:hypothetical protein